MTLSIVISVLQNIGLHSFGFEIRQKIFPQISEFPPPAPVSPWIRAHRVTIPDTPILHTIRCPLTQLTHVMRSEYLPGDTAG